MPPNRAVRSLPPNSPPPPPDPRHAPPRPGPAPAGYAGGARADPIPAPHMGWNEYTGSGNGNAHSGGNKAYTNNKSSSSSSSNNIIINNKGYSTPLRQPQHVTPSWDAQSEPPHTTRLSWHPSLNPHYSRFGGLSGEVTPELASGARSPYALSAMTAPTPRVLSPIWDSAEGLPTPFPPGYHPSTPYIPPGFLTQTPAHAVEEGSPEGGGGEDVHIHPSAAPHRDSYHNFLRSLPEPRSGGGGGVGSVGGKEGEQHDPLLERHLQAQQRYMERHGGEEARPPAPDPSPHPSPHPSFRHRPASNHGGQLQAAKPRDPFPLPSQAGGHVAWPPPHPPSPSPLSPQARQQPARRQQEQGQEGQEGHPPDRTATNAIQEARSAIAAFDSVRARTQSLLLHSNNAPALHSNPPSLPPTVTAAPAGEGGAGELGLGWEEGGGISGLQQEEEEEDDDPLIELM